MDPMILTVVGIYFAISLGLGFWVARGERNIADDYFLAGRKLPWYAVSMSMTGSNIGTEHFLGMVGSAYVLGLAPAVYEWGNFIPYSVLIWIFLPFFFRKKLYTIPEFLERRYNQSTRSLFACLTLLHMVLAVLVPALYAGGRILYEMGLDRTITEFNWGFMGCILIISAVTAAYCIYGGLLSVVWTDVLQVAILLIGGVLLVWIGSQDVGGLMAVAEENRQAAAEFPRMSLILPANHSLCPWTGVAMFGFTLSMWYVGTNQFYIQRCLGAKSEWDAKMGVVGCAFLKVFLPLIIVFPGLVAFVKFGPQQITGMAPDHVYVEMINVFLSPEGALGAVFGPLAQGLLLAALIAAIMSTVSSVLNSSSTIWSIDVHQRLLDSSASEAKLVKVGRWSTFVIIVIGTVLAPLLLWWERGIFVYIQGMAALFAPPIAVIFLLAFFWRRAHGRAATFTLALGMVVGALLWAGGEVLWTRNTADTRDPFIQQHIAEDRAIQERLAEDAVYRDRLSSILAGLAQDPIVRERLAGDAELRAEFAKDPEVQQRLREDSAAQERIAEDPVIRKRLEQDPLVQTYLAERRLVGWIPWLGEQAVAQTVLVISYVRPLLNRAAITWALCLIVMVISTFALRQDPREKYDPDAIWNPRWARLPAHERKLNRGPRNLMFWWLVMVAASASLFVIFR